jgi:DNA polymerase-3 subunit alpha
LDQDTEKPTIRFGLGAVKNVGEGPIETILSARQEGGPFADLDDFCRRVDLRSVNRRALESLIKVGALSPFGKRAELLPIVEQIIALSANQHNALDVGQMSLFGESTGVKLAAEETLLSADGPNVDIPQKEILDWERDLVGVYVSEHPLNRVRERLHQVLSGYAGALEEIGNGEQAIVAGIVKRVHRHTTKKGNRMAFVTLEDVRGSCDVVVFPSVWEKSQHLWTPESIVVVSGKVDASRRDEPSLLCSWVKRPDEITVATDTEPPSPDSEPPHAKAAGPKASKEEQPASKPRTIRVTLPRSAEAERDIDTLHRIHDALTAQKGQDRFVIRVVGNANGPVNLAFPGKTTHYCPELVETLTDIVGEGRIADVTET